MQIISCLLRILRFFFAEGAVPDHLGELKGLLSFPGHWEADIYRRAGKDVPKLKLADAFLADVRKSEDRLADMALADLIVAIYALPDGLKHRIDDVTWARIEAWGEVLMEQFPDYITPGMLSPFAADGLAAGDALLASFLGGEDDKEGPFR